MKKIILCIVLLVSGLTLGTYARGSRHAASQNTSVTVVSDTTGSEDDGSDESDTYDSTSDPAAVQAQVDSAIQQAFDQNQRDNSDSDSGFSFNGNRLMLLIVLIVFGFPVLLVAVILYFIYRNRKDKYELQKMAMEKEGRVNNGTAVNMPSYNVEKLPDSLTPNAILWEKGIRQMCLGIGLALLLGFIVDADFSVIGLLIFFIGLGKAVIAKTRKEPTENLNDFRVNQRYDTTPDASETVTNDSKPVADENKEPVAQKEAGKKDEKPL